MHAYSEIMSWDMLLDTQSWKTPSPFTPRPSTAAFRDLLIFEERLKQNAARMQERKTKYQGMQQFTYTVFLMTLCAFVLWMGYGALTSADEVGGLPNNSLCFCDTCASDSCRLDA